MKFEISTSSSDITILFYHLGMEHEIDIMETVLHLRNQRFGMVQTEVQCLYMYNYCRKLSISN